MTAAEAREAAAWFQRESQRMQDVVDGVAATGVDFKFTGLDYDERAARYRRAAAALDAFADGIDAAVVEREACAALCDAVAFGSEAALNVRGPWQWPASEELVLKESMTTAQQLARAIRARGVK